MGLGIGAVAAAARVASRSWRGVVAAATCLVVPLLLAVALLPDQRAADTVGHGLLAEFRAVSIASQVLFWGALTAVGASACGARASTSGSPRSSHESEAERPALRLLRRDLRDVDIVGAAEVRAGEVQVATKTCAGWISGMNGPCAFSTNWRRR